MQFSGFGREITCETTAIRKVTVKPLLHTTAGTILIIVSLIDFFASNASENRTCVAEPRGATIRQKAYCDILRYRKPVLRYILRYILYLYFSLLLFSIYDCAFTIHLPYKNSKKSNLNDI